MDGQAAERVSARAVGIGPSRSGAPLGSPSRDELTAEHAEDAEPVIIAPDPREQTTKAAKDAKAAKDWSHGRPEPQRA